MQTGCPASGFFSNLGYVWVSFLLQGVQEACAAISSWQEPRQQARGFLRCWDQEPSTLSAMEASAREKGQRKSSSALARHMTYCMTHRSGKTTHMQSLWNPCIGKSLGNVICKSADPLSFSFQKEVGKSTTWPNVVLSSSDTACRQICFEKSFPCPLFGGIAHLSTYHIPQIFTYPQGRGMQTLFFCVCVAFDLRKKYPGGYIWGG